MTDATTPPAEPSEIRKAFEAWAKDNVYPIDYQPDAECGVEGGPVYRDSRTHAAWWAYREGLQAQPAPADPMDWPLPCDVTVGHGTMRKGVRLGTLVARMKVLYEMAMGMNADEVAGRSLEERAGLQGQLFSAPAEAKEERCECNCRSEHECEFCTQHRQWSGDTPQPQAAQPSPTSGMTLAQRILHVGGRNNAAGYVEFGSTQAVEALVRQVLRDLPAAPALTEEQERDKRDAERYRRLRANLAGPVPMVRVQVMKRGQYLLQTVAGLDEAADALRSTQGGSNGSTHEPGQSTTTGSDT